MYDTQSARGLCNPHHITPAKPRLVHSPSLTHAASHPGGSGSIGPRLTTFLTRVFLPQSVYDRRPVYGTHSGQGVHLFRARITPPVRRIPRGVVFPHGRARCRIDLTLIPYLRPNSGRARGSTAEDAPTSAPDGPILALPLPLPLPLRSAEGSGGGSGWMLCQALLIYLQPWVRLCTYIHTYMLVQRTPGGRCRWRRVD